MKRILTFLLFAGLLSLCSLVVTSQQQKKEEKQELKTEISTEIPQPSFPAYNPAGRRDPFKDLLAKGEGERKTQGGTRGAGTQPQFSFEALHLVGIMKVGRQYTAIMIGSQEFPLYVRVGNRFTDGFILSISDSKVVFRRLREGGSPLAKPKDIVKELIL
jgi:Tfp pilus assembly protein PilP